MNSSPQTTARITPTVAAALAGLFDAEGCISASVFNGYGRLDVSITGEDEALLLWVSSYCGGRVRPTGGCLRWQPTSSAAAKFLKLTKQFLITKREQAECALAYLSLPTIAPKKRARLAEKISKIVNRKEPLCQKGIISRVTGWTPKASKTFIAYTALFLEGDGRLSGSECRFYGKHRPTLEKFQTVWGGTLTCTQEVGQFGSVNPYYKLCVPDEKKLRLLVLILPYLHGKKGAVEAMIARLKRKDIVEMA